MPSLSSLRPRLASVLVLLAASFLALSAHAQSLTVSIVSGNPQSTLVGTPFPAQLVVRVTDGKGVPVAGQEIEFFTVPSGTADGSVVALAGSTDTDGLISAEATAGNEPGTYVIRAAAVFGGKSTPQPQGVIASVDFTMTNLAGTPVESVALPVGSWPMLGLLVALLGVIGLRARTQASRD